MADPERDLATIANLMENGGTGGALFRTLYRDFLTESAALIAREHVSAVMRARDLYGRSARLWSEVAELIRASGTTSDPDMLVEAAGSVSQVADCETQAMALLAEALSPASNP